MSDTRRPSERMADAAIAVARHAARLGLGPDEDLAEALPGAVAAALDERDVAEAEVARLRLEHAQVLGAALRGVCERDGLARDARREAARAAAAEAAVAEARAENQRLRELLRGLFDETDINRYDHQREAMHCVSCQQPWHTDSRYNPVRHEADCAVGLAIAALAAAEEGEDDA